MLHQLRISVMISLYISMKRKHVLESLPHSFARSCCIECRYTFDATPGISPKSLFANDKQILFHKATADIVFVNSITNRKTRRLPRMHWMTVVGRLLWRILHFMDRPLLEFHVKRFVTGINLWIPTGIVLHQTTFHVIEFIIVVVLVGTFFGYNLCQWENARICRNRVGVGNRSPLFPRFSIVLSQICHTMP